MFAKQPLSVRPSGITEKSVYLSRRRFLEAGAVGVASLTAASCDSDIGGSPSPPPRGEPLKNVVKSDLSIDDTPNAFEDVTTYNNFYEFGTGKRHPALHAGKFKPLPWTISIKGECEKPGTYALEDIISPHQLEERIYPLRCVEAWSMVIPWVGVPLGAVLRRFSPTSRATYVAFRTIFRPSQMPGQQKSIIDWPYTEALRIDEATHPLTILAVGIYGEVLPNQNGAPVRLVVPWKYGFKSIKSIVEIEFTQRQPATTWSLSAPREYGFYANVNPQVDHPRWSQKRERRIGELKKRPTLMFNGFADQVGTLYAGMDLSKHF